MAKFFPKKNSLIHSFSITENFVIFIFSPVVYADELCVLLQYFHVTDCLSVLNNEYSEVFIVNLKNGTVIEMQGDILFSLHHINAYESRDGKEIFIDLFSICR